MFTEKDLQQFQKHGIALETIEQQIENFEKGFSFMRIIKPATAGDGILTLDEKKIESYGKSYEAVLNVKNILKFVPASGAASRMFKSLFAFLDTGDDQQKELPPEVRYFLDNIHKFAFFYDLDSFLLRTQNITIEEAIKQKKYKTIIQALLLESGLGYGTLPKGLLKFHQYENTSRTPLEEHLVEGANYCRTKMNKVRLHLTVSPEHKTKFQELFEQVKPFYQKKYDVEYELSFSVQKSSTDKIAVDLENKPFRNADGSILFRPGGHGSLIENLNDIDADLIFIKNIDNVVPDKLKSFTFQYKNALAGVLIEYQTQIFNYLMQLSDKANVSDELIDEVAQFLDNELCTISVLEFDSYTKSAKINYLFNKLNRPVRVCGMVKNEGEPGGGPFWAINPDGTISLQIVEMSQIDTNNPKMAELIQHATHFNPVDIVCGIKNYKGERFNLLNYINPQAGFISIKSKDGKDLKAQEHPGLWNGSMSDWNSIFVEVPILTFNPVKTINDLLREQHQ